MESEGKRVVVKFREDLKRFKKKEFTWSCQTCSDGTEIYFCFYF